MHDGTLLNTRIMDKIKYISYKQTRIMHSLIYHNVLRLGLGMGIDLWSRTELPQYTTDCMGR